MIHQEYWFWKVMDLILNPTSNTGCVIPKLLISLSPLSPVSGDLKHPGIQHSWVSHSGKPHPKVILTWCRQWEQTNWQVGCNPPGLPQAHKRPTLLPAWTGVLGLLSARTLLMLHPPTLFLFLRIAEEWPCISGENPVWSWIWAIQESCRQNLEQASFADLQFFLSRAGDTGGLSYFCARQPRASHRGHSADHKMVISKYLLHCVVKMVKNSTWHILTVQ